MNIFNVYNVFRISAQNLKSLTGDPIAKFGKIIKNEREEVVDGGGGR